MSKEPESPQADKEENLIPLSTSVPADVHQRIKTEATADDRTIAAQARRVLTNLYRKGADSL